jgi:hypothetical protein
LNIAASAIMRIAEIMRMLLVLSGMIPISPAIYRIINGTNMTALSCVAERTSVTLEDVITFNSILDIAARGSSIEV